MRAVRLWLGFGVIVAVAACVPRPAAPPAEPPPTVSLPTAAPPAPPAPPPEPAHWRDAALTPGGWSYRSEGGASIAAFGLAGAAPALTVRCDRARRQISLARAGTAAANSMTIRTTFGARSFGASAQPGALVASLAASDPFLDTMAFSRGRFTVETAGMPMLIIPAWPEPARVVEDCRA